MVSSCFHVAVVVVLVCPYFPSFRYILCGISLIMSSYPFEMIGSWPHVATVVVLVYFISHLSDICSYYFPHNVLIFQFLRRRVVYCIYDCCKDSRSIFFPVENGGSSWNFWELAIGERGQLELKDEKENMPLVGMVAIVTEVYGTVCQLYLINAFEHDSGDIKALWSQSIYIDMYYCTLWAMQMDMILTSGGEG